MINAKPCSAHHVSNIRYEYVTALHDYFTKIMVKSYGIKNYTYFFLYLYPYMRSKPCVF
jgi:hypothetical protein